jgi:acetyl esterase/lipase
MGGTHVSRFRIAAWLLAGAWSCSAFAAVSGPQRLPLWPQGAPGGTGNGGEETVRVTEQGEHVVSNVHQPSLTVYLPEKNASGAAVIVIPGGGHRELWTDHEGHNVAKFLNQQGVAAFVLYYRLERAPGSTYKVEEHALADLERAVRLVRSRAKQWGINPDKIGTLGFSAGGQLALLGAIRHDAGDAAAADAVNRQSSRPDFAALIYPGGWPDAKFDTSTPPMFLLAGSDDRPGVITMLTQTFAALREAKVPAELHFYDGVPHGFGLRAGNTGPVSHWLEQFVDWLRVRKILQLSQGVS